MLHPSKESDHILNGVQTLKLISWIVFWWSSVTLCSFCIKKHELEVMVQISSYFLALKVDTDVSLLFQRGCSWPSWMGVAVEGQGWRRALIGLLLLRGGVVGGAGCCSLLCSETIKWTVISDGRLHVSFHKHLQSRKTHVAQTTHFTEHMTKHGRDPQCNTSYRSIVRWEKLMSHQLWKQSVQVYLRRPCSWHGASSIFIREGVRLQLV